MNQACKCQGLQYYDDAKFCHECGGEITPKQVSNSLVCSGFCEGCAKRVPQFSTHCFRCGRKTKATQINLSPQNAGESKEEYSYTLIAEALMRPSGATACELRALSLLLRARFPKGDCQVVRRDNVSDVIGFHISGANVHYGSSAVLSLAKHYGA